MSTYQKRPNQLNESTASRMFMTFDRKSFPENIECVKAESLHVSRSSNCSVAPAAM